MAVFPGIFLSRTWLSTWREHLGEPFAQEGVRCFDLGLGVDHLVSDDDGYSHNHLCRDGNAGVIQADPPGLQDRTI